MKPVFNQTNYQFDGSWFGFLTAVFDAYDRKQKQVKISLQSDGVVDLFEDSYEVITDELKAKRVWEGLKKKLSSAHHHDIYCVFLSEDRRMLQVLFEYIQCVFDNPIGFEFNYGNKDVLEVAQMAKKVNREKHRMKAFIRFQKANDGSFFAVINPDYNVIPLLVKHFTNRYADQRWVIYDERRHYGIQYDLHQIHEVRFATERSNQLVAAESVQKDEKEELYTKLWKDYFQSTNIKERKNMKLHLQHVPRRYWRYLTEKEV